MSPPHLFLCHYCWYCCARATAQSPVLARRSTRRRPDSAAEKRRAATTSRAASGGPWHRPNNIGDDERPIPRVPCHDCVCLCQRPERGHRSPARRHVVPLVVLKHDQDFGKALPVLAIPSANGGED